MSAYRARPISGQHGGEGLYATETAGTGELHAYPDPDPELFTAETPLGHYQGITDQVRMSDTPGSYRHILVPRGSGRPEWLPLN
ncbi:hypothetical protein [Saccharothrix sp. ST-888]|uniref:hypothetical protein n=1 Tax=Saccharothrix sp. ST-888 TaxID=1427391 RepID=UPI0005EBFEFE|nr:hypothetical protein UK12_19915 [Saccharothrix sp. ST-888]